MGILAFAHHHIKTHQYGVAPSDAIKRNRIDYCSSQTTMFCLELGSMSMFGRRLVVILITVSSSPTATGKMFSAV
jgi:hypothetical protein